MVCVTKQIHCYFIHQQKIYVYKIVGFACMHKFKFETILDQEWRNNYVAYEINAPF